MEDWLKDLSPTALMAGCLIYVVRFLGNHMSSMTKIMSKLVESTSRIEGKVDDCPHGRR